MSEQEQALLRNCNFSRYQPGRGGFYESFFQRANHPARPLAFWIRYTSFVPGDPGRQPLGELWAVFFDGERDTNVATKTEIPLGQCRFATDRFDVRVGGAVLRDGELRGMAESGGHSIHWDLRYAGGGAPLFLLPPSLYSGGFPKAKSLVGSPLARFSGRIEVDGQSVAIEDWIGSQNHNWGVRHTDRYAYGQVCGFDNAPESFLEVATGRLRMGRAWTPYFTPLVLRHDGQEIALRSLWQSLVRARGRFGYFDWTFRSRARGLSIEGRIQAERSNFVGLRYYNPPGGDKSCLNTKVASCTLTLRRDGKPGETLESRHRAAFEILTDDADHGVEIRA